jgi:GntR family transcriptional regulator/MocR family aminotransferase
MSAPRRLALLAWARRSAAWILEDDYDSEFRYEGRPLPSLQGMETNAATEAGEPRRVLYIGTFSKALAPGLRLGYLIAPDELGPALRAARMATDLHSTTFEQGVLADFIGGGHYGRHLRRVRALYAERQAALLEAAAREGLVEQLGMAADPAGLHLVAWLPAGVSGARVVEEAFAEGVLVQALRVRKGPCGAGGEVDSFEREALLLGYAGYDEERIRAGVAGLTRALARASRRGGGAVEVTVSRPRGPSRPSFEGRSR